MHDVVLAKAIIDYKVIVAIEGFAMSDFIDMLGMAIKFAGNLLVNRRILRLLVVSKLAPFLGEKRK